MRDKVTGKHWASLGWTDFQLCFMRQDHFITCMPGTELKVHVSNSPKDSEKKDRHSHLHFIEETESQKMSLTLGLWKSRIHISSNTHVHIIKIIHFFNLEHQLCVLYCT